MVGAAGSRVGSWVVIWAHEVAMKAIYFERCPMSSGRENIGDFLGNLVGLHRPTT